MVHYMDHFMEGKLRNLSVNGALVQLENDMPMQPGVQCLITIHLNIFESTLHFLAEVRHSHGNAAGVKFLFMDSDTKIYLDSLLAFRTANQHLISEEYDYSSRYNNSSWEGILYPR